MGHNISLASAMEMDQDGSSKAVQIFSTLATILDALNILRLLPKDNLIDFNSICSLSISDFFKIMLLNSNLDNFKLNIDSNNVPAIGLLPKISLYRM
ncbi:MAG: hypothetical protein WCJ39_08645 [bacterium]